MKKIMKAAIAVSISLAAIQSRATTPTYDENSCSSVLTGLVDYRKTKSEVDIWKAYENFIEKNTFRNFESFREASGKIGVTVKKIGLDFGGSKSRHNKSTFDSRFKHLLKTNEKFRTKFFEEVKKANPQVVQAWLDCKKMYFNFLSSSTSSGLVCQALHRNNDEVLFVVQANLYPGDGSVSNYRLEYDETKVSHRIKPWRWNDRKNPPLTKKGLEFVFKRRPGVDGFPAGRINFITSDGRYTCEVGSNQANYPAIKKEVSEPLPTHPAPEIREIEYGELTVCAENAWYYDGVVKAFNTMCLERGDGTCSFPVHSSTVTTHGRNPGSICSKYTHRGLPPPPDSSLKARIEYSCGGVNKTLIVQGTKTAYLDCTK